MLESANASSEVSYRRAVRGAAVGQDHEPAVAVNRPQPRGHAGQQGLAGAVLSLAPMVTPHVYPHRLALPVSQLDLTSDLSRVEALAL